MSLPTPVPMPYVPSEMGFGVVPVSQVPTERVNPTLSLLGSALSTLVENKQLSEQLVSSKPAPVSYPVSNETSDDENIEDGSESSDITRSR